MSLVIFDCEQGSPDWFAARLGIVTSSEFQKVLSPVAGKEGLGRQEYLRKLAGEILTGEPMENYSNKHMEHGKEIEDYLRNTYALIHDAEPVRVGFVRNGQAGCSPDSFIGSNGGMEIKRQLPHILIDTLTKDSIPTTHTAQVQGSIWLTEREWWDVVIGYKKMPLFVKRAYRDEAYIKKLAEAVDQFNDELAALVERIRRYGKAESIAA